MVRKVSIMICSLALIFAFGMTAQGATHQVYEGNPSNTYIQYFKDIISGMSFTDNYVAFRSGQYDYTLVVGKLEYTNGEIRLVGQGEIYTISQEGNYNSYYKYDYAETSNFSVNPSDKIIYSDIGNYPHLVERGAQYEIFTAVLLCTALLCVVVGRFFRHR